MGDAGRAAPYIKEVRRRLELALKPVASPPALEEVLKRVSKHGVLHGPLDWAFPAWIAYVEHAVQKIVETFPLSEGERRQLMHFRDTLKRLLHEAWVQARAKLAAIYKAIVEGTCRVEGKRLYAPDWTWIYISKRSASYLAIHGVSAEVHFPDVLKLPRERLELLQLGWRASDETEDSGRPAMGTSQPWQLPAWAAVRYGELRIYITRVSLTREGASIHVYVRAKSWEQRWGKGEAIGLVAEHFKRGEWAPLLAMWLGDGKSKLRGVLSGQYALVIVAKEPLRLSSNTSAREALVATGKEAFVRLREAAGMYGTLLDLLGAHKWAAVKLATDDAFRAVYKLRTKKRNIDILREKYGQSGVEASAEWPSYDRQRKDAVVVAGIKMLLHLISNKGGSLRAEYYANNVREALAIASKLESAGLRPNVARSGHYYVVYIATADLLWLAEKDVEIRRSIAHYLAEKARSGTARQREVARKLMQRHPSLFSPSGMPTFKHGPLVPAGPQARVEGRRDSRRGEGARRGAGAPGERGSLHQEAGVQGRL
ncbi:MAG: hypothetical protein LM577_09035 [Thermoproteaceae archaeon]|nr:hypothetical protein [Thermoproteaceae archaeon]